MVEVMLVQLIVLAERILSLLVIVYVVLSYFVSPWNTVRRTLARIVEPMLEPLRRFIPPLGPLDLSPIVLLILISVVAQVLISLVTTIF